MFAADVQILRVAEIEKKDDVKRPYIRQLLEPGLKFPLPHRRESPFVLAPGRGLFGFTDMITMDVCF